VICRASAALELGDATHALAALDHYVQPGVERIVADRNRPILLAILARIACSLEERRASTTLITALEPYDGLHAGAGWVYVGPVSYALGRLQGVLGEPLRARQYFERACKESVRASSASYRAWSEYHRARTIEAKGPREIAERERLRASAAHTATALGMGALLDEMARNE
jgi:ATP/maltotriose-dependent transcriptional regulator MalT